MTASEDPVNAQLQASATQPAAVDKTLSARDVAALIEPGMTVGIGGWGSRRKPMALVQALIERGVGELTVVSYGGPDVGMLCRAGLVKKLVFGFVSLDSVALEPFFRAARQAGEIEVLELDEGMFWLGLQAAAWRVPFLPTRAGLGSGVMQRAPSLATVTSPYDDGETLLAMPALRLDVALLHANLADTAGNAAFTGPDAYFDDLFAMAATRTYVSAERVVPHGELLQHCHRREATVHRLWVSGVVHAPKGAGFTECLPDYPRDEAAQRAYVQAAKKPRGAA